MELQAANDTFAALAEVIIHTQLSPKAAATIRRRFTTLSEGSATARAGRHAAGSWTEAGNDDGCTGRAFCSAASATWRPNTPIQSQSGGRVGSHRARGNADLDLRG